MTADRASGFITGIDASGMEFDLKADAVIGIHERRSSACPGTSKLATIHTASGKIEMSESIGEVRAAVRECIAPTHGMSPFRGIYDTWATAERIRQVGRRLGGPAIGVDLAEPGTDRTAMTRVRVSESGLVSMVGCVLPPPAQPELDNLSEPQRSHETRIERIWPWNQPVTPMVAANILIGVANKKPASEMRQIYGLSKKSFRSVYDLVGHSARHYRSLASKAEKERYVNGLLAHWRKRVAAAQKLTKEAA